MLIATKARESFVEAAKETGCLLGRAAVTLLAPVKTNTTNRLFAIYAQVPNYVGLESV